MSETHTVGNLTIEVERDEQVARLTFLGAIDSKEPAVQMEPLLRQIAHSGAAKQLVMNFRELSFLNSASIGFLINFIKKMINDHFSLTICFDESVNWQRVCGRGMRTIFMRNQQVSVLGGEGSVC